MQANFVIDQETTEAARQKAADAVEPILYLQGQNIIRAGAVVRQNQLEMLKSLGLLQNDEHDNAPYYGAALLTILGMGILIALLQLLTPETLHDVKRTLVLCLTMVLQMALSAVASIAVSLIFVFFIYDVDYRATEYLQFEDDDYYYYVKAMPKITVRPMLDEEGVADEE